MIASGHHKGASDAFTLVEVLATLALLAIVLPSVMNAFSTCLNSARATRDRNVAVALAQSKLHELTLEDQSNRSLTDGDFGPAWPDYRWTATLSEWDTVLQQIEVEVFWTHSGKEHRVDLATLVRAEAGE